MSVRTSTDAAGRESGNKPPRPAKPGKVDKTDPEQVDEIGGAKGPEPTRYGDWQHKGRVSDF